MGLPLRLSSFSKNVQGFQSGTWFSGEPVVQEELVSMSYPSIVNAIRAMFRNVLLEDPMPKAMARKAGLRAGTPGAGSPVSVMHASWIVESSINHSTPFRDENDPRGILWDPGAFPSDLPYWPTGEALYVALADLSGFVEIRNMVFVDPATPHPDLNVKVEASLDGATWGDVTADEDWKFAAANVNLGGWPETVGQIRGGAIASAWLPIASIYQTEVRLRWRFFESEAEGLYNPALTSGPLVFGYADVQAR